MADVNVTINNLTVIEDSELSDLDTYVSEGVLTADSVDKTVGETRRWVLTQLRTAGVAETEVPEDNGETGETDRQETLRPAAGFYWLYAAFRKESGGDPRSLLMEKASHYLKRAEAEMKMVIGPPLLLGGSAEAESATSLGRPTPMRIGP